ncbi:TonB-dependent siderophore receptor [Maricaulis sp. W15]|uniref:TonB-dependent receptor plug domain-containing protein n=1 Tax=Maricaulis sp. W15 TaxID=1772333 RepID=UPI0013010EE9|nr:TonB-dependent receptor [Maricaulis sp. W15]
MSRATTRGALMVGAAMSAIMLASTAGLAQQTGETPAGANQDDTIVVTGSRIRRTNATTAIPTQIFTTNDIVESGTVDVGELLAAMPGVDADLSPENSELSIQNSGLSTVNLRGLGADRTLVLINGRRAVSNSGNGERVSLQTIPAGFVQSIEVTTGGASAIYGSDAIAGVANIILERDFDGIEVNARYGFADASGEEETTVELTMGRNFDNDRGNIMFGASYDHETPIYADETRPDSLRFDDWSGNGEFNDIYLSSYIPGGRFESDDAWNVDGVWYNDQSLAPNDGRNPSVGFETDLDGFNFRPGRTLSPEVTAYTAALAGRYEFDNGVEATADFLWSRVDSLYEGSYESAIYSTDVGPLGNTFDIGQIASNHPFIPAAVEETRSGSVSWYRRFVEVGQETRDNERTTARAAFGLAGDLGETWRWQTFATYGRFEQNQIQGNNLNYLNIHHALDIESDGNGGYQCVDAGARADGCVPLDIFGEGSITPEMADYIRIAGHVQQIREQTVLGGSVDGDLFEMPAGTVAAAFGIEWREESQDTNVDAIILEETTSLSVVPEIEASFDVVEAFAELEIPLFSNVTAQLAGRVADYSTIGTIYSYNAGGYWEPTDSLRLRGQYSRSQRAPTITEIFSAPRQDSDSLLDPCDGLMPDGSGVTPPAGSDFSAATISANCLSEAGIQAYFADPNNAGQPFEFDGSVNGPNAGNLNVREETADTFTVGAVWAPSFAEDLYIIVDYYNIRVEDAIGSISTQTTVDLCYGAADFPNNRFCDVITRDASDGRVVEVINRQENLNELLSEGIDVSVMWDFEVDSLPGEFGLDLRYSRSLADEFEFVGEAGQPVREDSNGSMYDPTHEARARLSWSEGGFYASYTLHYESGGIDDLDVDPTDPLYFVADDQFRSNVYARYRFDNDYRTSVYAGVTNLFDEMGPFMPGNFASGSSSNINSPQNSLVGRQFYFGIRSEF